MRESLKETILRTIDDLDIFYKYLGGHIPLGKAIKSPLRDEKHPSFNIYRAKNGRIYYNDFAGDRGDCFDFVKELHDCNFKEAIEIIAGDFSISKRSSLKRKRIVKIPKLIITKRKEVACNLRPIKYNELTYWNSYGILNEYMQEYGIWGAQSIKFGNAPEILHTEDDPLYVITYQRHPDIDGPVKSYRPLTKRKSDRFRSNIIAGDIYGLHQLKEAGRQSVALICAGQKDVVSLYANTGIRGIALNSESSILPVQQYMDLRQYSDRFVVCYDNDKTGEENMDKLSQQIGIPAFRISEFTSHNDIADYFKHGGTRKQFIQRLSETYKGNTVKS